MAHPKAENPSRSSRCEMGERENPPIQEWRRKLRSTDTEKVQISRRGWGGVNTNWNLDKSIDALFALSRCGRVQPRLFIGAGRRSRLRRNHQRKIVRGIVRQVDELWKLKRRKATEQQRNHEREAEAVP